MIAPAACVIGHPVAHSRSPLIHGHWLRSLGIEGRYDRQDVSPERVEHFLLTLLEQGYIGGNVTIPHKEAALRVVAEADATARAIGAVNTVWIEDGRLKGANTDVYGFLANLDAEAPGWDAEPGHAVVLGAGGAARAVAYGLACRGFRTVSLINRDTGRARAVAAAIGGPLAAHGWEDCGRLLTTASLLVNATSLGMTGKDPLRIDLAGLPSGAVVNDLVYAPLETGLLAAARARGLRAVDGLGMLLHQAVPGFERWFGVRPEVTQDVRALVVADLERASVR